MATNPVTVSNLFPRSGASPIEKAISAIIDYSAAGDISYLIDPTQVQNQNLFGVPRSIYIDNSKGTEAVQGYCLVTQMTFDIPPFSQGIIPISSVQNGKIMLTSGSSNTNQTFVEIYNYEQRAVLWSVVGPFIPGQLTGVDGEDETTIMSPTNPFAVAPKDCETVVYGRSDIPATGASTVVVVAQGTPNFVTLTNAGDLTGATAGGPIYVKVGAAAVAEQGRLLTPGQSVTLPYRTKLAINAAADAAGYPSSILYELAH